MANSKNQVFLHALGGEDNLSAKLAVGNLWDLKKIFFWFPQVMCAGNGRSSLLSQLVIPLLTGSGGGRMTKSVVFYKILPLCFISRIFGVLTRLPLPRWALRRAIAWYSAKFGVNTGEYVEPAAGFRTFNEFFTRRLKDSARPVDSAVNAVVSPVDARVDQYGRIDGTMLIQAKGIAYSVGDLVPSEMHRHFLDGDFITLYLSPGDYHRIHAPLDGTILGYQHVPGRLYTVQDFMVKAMPDLFSVNERITTYLRAPSGLAGVCMVGAANVGRITLSYDTPVTNKTFRSMKERLYVEDEQKTVRKGGELGVFNLGSTVVLVFEKGMVRFDELSLGSKLRMGERIGVLAR